MEFNAKPSRIDLLRWTGSAAVVLAAYTAIGWFVLVRAAPVVDQGGGEPAIEIELQPLPAAAPEPPSELMPGPPPVQAESQAAAASQSPVETVEDAKTQPPVTGKTEAEPSPAETPQPVSQTKPMATTDTPPAIAPSPAIEAPPPTAPESVEAPPGPPVPSAPGQTVRPPSRAVLTWQRLLVSRLERAKRYPVQADGREGATTVLFTIDRAGRLVGSHIVRSSGSPVFDAATLDLLERSQPFPRPPHDVGAAQLSFVVTIRYAR